jgi:carboxymethylenebutenolidase
MPTATSLTVSCDSGEMDLHVWIPDSGSGPALLLIQEIFGVGAYIRAVAQRLAEAGYVVGAPDVFWRFAPGWQASHDEAGLVASLEKVAELDGPMAVADCIAAAAVLEEMDQVDGNPGVIGFCLGGTLALSVAAYGDPAVCVSYYGSGVPDMIAQIEEVACPTLFHFGSIDAYIPNEGIEALAAAIVMREQFRLNLEPAGHAFDNHESEMFHDAVAAASAWAITMEFLDEHLPADRAD